MRRWGLRERERRRRESGEGLRERLSRPKRSGIELRVSGAVVRVHGQKQAAFATRHVRGHRFAERRSAEGRLRSTFARRDANVH